MYERCWLVSSFRFKMMSWQRDCGIIASRPSRLTETAAFHHRRFLQTKAMNQSTERIQASRSARRPLHISCLRALVTVALVRSSTFSAVRTSCSSSSQAPACHVMAFAPPPVSPIPRGSKSFDANDNHAIAALHMAPPSPGRRDREIEIRRKVSEM